MRWLNLVVLLAILFAAIAIAVRVLLNLRPYIEHELYLQYHCHLNTSHLAQENVRLVNEVKKKRQEIEEMREEMRQCKNDVEKEYSAANRSYWHGVNVTVSIITVIGIFCLYFVCKVLVWCSRLRFWQGQPPPAQPPRYRLFW